MRLGMLFWPGQLPRLSRLAWQPMIKGRRWGRARATSPILFLPFTNYDALHRIRPITTTAQRILLGCKKDPVEAAGIVPELPSAVSGHFDHAIHSRVILAANENVRIGSIATVRRRPA